MTFPGTVERRDPVSGVIEEISYFGSAPQMLGFIHLPAGEVRGAVVVCSSTHAELLKSYHLEVRLARALATVGFAVHRFHYRGDGNSAGDIGALTMPAMLETATEVTERLVARTGITRVAFLGVRLGAFPAAALSRKNEGAPLVLWDPVLDTNRFVRDALRGHAIAALKGEAKPESTQETMDRLALEGSIDLLGYEFTQQFYESIQGQTLMDRPPRGAKVLVVPFGSTNMKPLQDAWEAGEVDISSLDGTKGEAWWLDEQATRDREDRGAVLASLTADWFADTFVNQS